MTTGGRVIFSVNCVGGVLKDMDDTMLKTLVQTINEMAKELRPIAESFLRITAWAPACTAWAC